MASSLTTLKGLTLPTNLGDAGVWGTELNNGVMSVLDTILAGTTTLWSSASLTPTLTSSEGQTQRIVVNGTGSSGLAGNVTVNMPSSNFCAGLYVGFINATFLSSLSVTFSSTTGGTTAFTPTTYNSNFLIYLDGSGNISAATPVSATPQSSCSYEFIFDGGPGQVPATGRYIYLESPFTSSLARWTILTDTAGTCTMEIAICTYAGFSSAQGSIRGGNTVGITGVLKNQGTIASSAGWTTTIASGSILQALINNGATGFTKLTLSLVGQRTVS